MRSGLSPRLAAIAGRAVLTMVASSVCMKKPTATSHSRMRKDLSSCAAGFEGDEVVVTGSKKPPEGGFLHWGSAHAQTEKLEPQPQVVVAFGFLMTNWAPCRSSL